LYGTKGISRNVTLVYLGKTIDVPEEIAKECVNSIDYDIANKLYQNYSDEYWKHSAKDSIQSACNQRFCIIYKTI
jgi:hypothetical protein